MKNLKFLSMMLMLMVGLFSFSACSSDDDDDDYSNPLVGTWVQNHTSNATSYATYTFNRDGSGSQSVTSTVTGNTSNFPFSYSYSAKDEILSLRYNDGDQMRCSVSVTGKTLVLNFTNEVITLTKQ